MENPPDLPQLGEIVSGKYELVRLLGKGGMGAVYEARHVRLQQRVAIKFLKPELMAHADCVTRFEREGRAAARMTSSNAARIYDVDATHNGIPYMVIEFLEGHDLSVELRERQSLPVAEAVDIVLQACSAMAEAHSLGVVHRDLKPANLFLCFKGSTRTIKVLDFGVSKILADEMPQTTTPSLTLGTPQYMSPEQILASRDVDLQSDIWSLGVILYKLLSGRLPFEADSATAFVVTVVTTDPVPLEKVSPVPKDLADAVMKALAKKRHQRWSVVADFAQAIEPYGSGRIAFHPASGLPPPPSSSRLPATIDVPVDFDTRMMTETKSTSGEVLLSSDGIPSSEAGAILDAPPTVGNWTQSRKSTFAKQKQKRRVGMMIAAAAFVVGVVGVVLGLSHTTQPEAPAGGPSQPTPPTASAEPAPPSATPPVAETAPTPAASARPEPPRKPPAPAASATHKPPVQAAPPIVTTAAPPPSTAPRPSHPTHPTPNPVNDPVHL